MLILHGTPVVAFASSEQLAIGAASAARPPNIVYFVTDDQDQMLGGSFPTTAPGMATPLPKVRELMVEGGATFENMFIHVPICNPSRSTTLTGRYFHNIKTTDTPWGAMHCDMAQVHNHSFAVRLQHRFDRTRRLLKALRMCFAKPPERLGKVLRHALAFGV